MTTYKQRLEQFLRNKYYIAAVVIIAVMGYGFSITHTSVGIDDLEGDRYFKEDHVMLSIGRFGRIFWNKLFENDAYSPYQAFATDLAAMLLLIASSIQFCILLQRASKNRFTMAGCILFSCTFISYPLINEIWEYTEVNLDICGGYLLVGLSVYAIYETIHVRELSHKTKAFYILFSLLSNVIITSAYESLASVYVLSVFAVLFLQTLTTSKDKFSWKELIKEGLFYAAALLIGIILKLVIQRTLLFVLNIEQNFHGDIQILWGTQPLKSILEKLFSGLLYQFIDQAFWYFPVSFLMISVIVFVSGLIISSVKQKDTRRFFTGIGLLLSLIILPIIQGTSSPNRACQTHAFFVAFIVLLVFTQLRKYKIPGALFAIAMGILCIHQAAYLNYISALNYARSEYEADVVKTIGMDLYRAGYNKRIVFVGECAIPNSIMDPVILDENELQQYNNYRKLTAKDQIKRIKIIDSNVNSVLNWAIHAFNGDGITMHKLFAYYGYDIEMMNRNNPETNEAQSYVQENAVPAYPQNGYLVDRGDYVIVNLGNL